jgi:general secretion pathway protein M
VSIAQRPLLARAVALAILAGLIALLWVGPVAAYLNVLDTDGQALSAAQQTLERYRALASAAPQRVPVEDKSMLLPDISEAQAVALLQESLKGAAAAAQVDIQGLQVLQTDTFSGAPRIGVRLRGHADIGGLANLLYAIEAARPLLFPDNLTIQSRSVAPASPPSSLDFQIDVSAFKSGPRA